MMNELISKQIDDIFALWTNGICPGGQVLVQQHGKTIYERCFGYADIENRVPITPDTIFHVASVSKQFTVMAVMLLARDGLVDLDADIREYIGEYVAFKDRVTVRDLMNNNSGIRDLFEMQDIMGISNDDISTQSFVLRLCSRQREVNFEPESRYSYSNTNFILLSAIVENVTGKAFPDFLKERIFKPLVMEHSAVRDKYWTCIPNRSKSFIDNGTEYFYNPLVYGLYGATALNTCARDLAKWMRNYSEHIICDQAIIDEMTTVTPLKNNAPTTYACGLWVGSVEGHRYLIHVGEDAGFRTVTLRLRDDDLNIIILSNTNNTPTDPSAWKIARLILGMESLKSAEKPVKEKFDVSEAAGFYYAELPSSAIVKIVEKNGCFYWCEKYGLTPLTRVRGNLFRAGRLETYFLLGADKPMYYTPEETVCLNRAVDAPVCECDGKRYEGRYYCDELETFYNIVYENGKLYMDHIRRGRTTLRPVGRGRFVAEYLRTCFVQFEENEKGEVTGLYFSGVRVAHMPFTKVSCDK